MKRQARRVVGSAAANWGWMGGHGDAIAILSDVHGNLWALDAVLRDIDDRGTLDVVHLGDAVYGPLDPRGTARRMIERGIPSVCGNEDRLVVRPEGENATAEFVRAELGTSELQWLSEFPRTATLGRIFLCHGTPGDDETYLLRDIASEQLRLRSDEDIAARLGGVGQDVVLCGHDHTPAVVRLRDGRLIVNPGSVGCPAYRDARPSVHTVEMGSPHARYAILRRGASGWACDRVAVPYDWDAASAEAFRNGRPDWALALATGRAG